MKKRVKIIMFLIITLLIVLFGKNISFAGDAYITGEKNNPNGYSVRKDKTGKYKQDSSRIADILFENLDNELLRGQYLKKGTTDNRVQISYTTSMQDTDVVYCVNRGGTIDHSYRWVYYMRAYIKIKGSTVIVYKSTNTGYTEEKYENVANAQELAAAVSVNGPFALKSGGNPKNLLGYGASGNYNTAQELVYYYWNVMNFPGKIGLGSYRNYNSSDYTNIMSDLKRASNYLTEFMKESDMEYEAQLIYLETDKPIAKVIGKDGKLENATSWKDHKTPVKNAQQLLMAVGEGKEKETEKVQFTIKKNWNLSGRNEGDVIYPDSVTVSIYDKKTGKFTGKSVTLGQRYNSETQKNEWVSNETIELDGKIEDYDFKENAISEWKLEGSKFIDKTESNESKIKKGVLELTNKFVPSGGIDRNVIKISGKVFLDADSNKAGATTNGICDSNNPGIGGIEVVWRRSDGVIISSTKTADDGTYSMQTSAKIWLKGYDAKYNGGDNLLNRLVSVVVDGGLYYFDEENFDKFNDSYVEFKYNGVEYTTSKVPTDASTNAEASKAETSDIERLILDSKFNEVDYNGVTTTNLLNGIFNIIGDQSIEASIKNIIGDNSITKPDGDYNEAIGKVDGANGLNKDNISGYFGELGDAENTANSVNGQTGKKDFYKNMLGNLNLGGIVGSVLDVLNDLGDSAGLNKILEILGEYLKIKSYEEGSVNQLLDIFDIKSKIDMAEYALGEGNKKYNIQYEKDEDGNSIAQMNQKDLSTYKIKASTKNKIKKMLTEYKFSKSYKHTEYTKYCNAPQKHDYESSISNKYNDLAITFEDNIAEGEHSVHTWGDVIDSNAIKYLNDFLKDFKFVADPDVSSGSYKSFISSALINTSLNSHFGIFNCNGFVMHEGTIDPAFEAAKQSLIASLNLFLPPIGTIVASTVEALLANVHLYDVQYEVDTTLIPKFGHAYGAKMRTDAWEIKNVNCGLIKREQPDAKVESDIIQATVRMKNQTYTYNYKLREQSYQILQAVDVANIGTHIFNLPGSNNQDIISSNDINKLKLLAESINGQYTRKINPSDIAYVNSDESRKDEFEIYVTYYVCASNQSNTLPMRINEIINYYEDDCYTYSGDYGYVDSSGKRWINRDIWEEAKGDEVETTGNYKGLISKYTSNVWLLPGSKTEEIPVTYKLNLTKDMAGKMLLNKKLVINNISEVASYTTRYGLNTMCVNGESVLKHPWMLLSSYAGVDKDSRPGNAISDVINGITQLLQQHGIDVNLDVSDKVSKLGDSLSSSLMESGVPTVDFIVGKLNDSGLSNLVSSKLNDLIATGIEELLNNIVKEMTDRTGVNIYNLLQKMEDDTSMAPLFKLDLTENYRTISGIVFEDKDSESREKQRIGNGEYDEGEKGASGVRVELHRIDSNGVDQGIATLYGIDENGNSIIKEAVTYTDENGKYSLGETIDGEKGYGYGVIEDHYKLYYIYGDDDQEINEYVIDKGGAGEQTVQKQTVKMNSMISNIPIDARNYKSTIITSDVLKDVFENENSVNKDNWHIILNQDSNKYSVAIDDWEQRQNINSKVLQYNTYDEKYNMSSNTNSFLLGVEYRTDSNSKVNKNGEISNDEKFKTNVDLNFGIIERPRENIIVDKTISKLKLKFANGQILFDGDPYSGELPYLIALGPKDIRANSNTRDRLIRIEMDTELMQSAELQITYKISVTNYSEIDYNTKDYYYYGIAATNEELVTGSVPLLVDYLDSECEFVENSNESNSIWKVKSIEDLAGLIYENNDAEIDVKKAIQAGKYTILTTDYFTDVGINETKSATLYVTKLLSTKADEYTFENHTEILQIDGNRARTIKEVDDRTREQVTKEYKPGNYMPSTEKRNDWKKDNTAHISKVGMHEQDDDRITIRITPPTGVITRNGYIAIMIVSLLVIGLGAFAIKKKVLNK